MHLAVIAHAELRVKFCELVPVAALAQQQQPVVAQTVFLVGASPALQESVHLSGLGLLQPRTQFPVRGPGLQGMAARARQQRGKPLLVALAEGLLHLQDGVIAAVLRPGPRRGGGQGSAGDQRCQNLHPKHWGIM